MSLSKMSTHNYRISNLRAIAILTVMLGHSMIIYSNNWSLLATDVASPLFCFIKESIIDLYQMPLFFVISGYLFHNTLMRDWNFEHFLLKKFRRLMVPYFMVALFWLIPIRYIIGYYKISDIPHVMYTIVIGTSNSHLWFVAALFLIFIVFYLFFGILGKYRTDNRTIGITLLALFFAIKLLPTPDFIPARKSSMVVFGMVYVGCYFTFIRGLQRYSDKNHYRTSNDNRFQISLWNLWSSYYAFNILVHTIFSQ